MGFNPPERKLPLAFIMAVAGSFLFAGCGDGRLNADSLGGDSVLRGTTARIIGFDPVATGDLASSRAMPRIYEGLFEYDYLARPYQVKPLLAESMPEMSADGLTYTFRIRRGICFSDDPCFPGGEGRELTAADVVYSIKRLADLNTLSAGYWTVRGKIEGLDAFRAASEGRPECYGDVVSGLQALDPYTLRIKLIEPYPQFMWVMAMHYFGVVPHEAVDWYGEAFVNHPVGTGAYRLKEWQRNYRIEYERNPAWVKHGRTDSLPPSTFDRIVDYIVGDGTTQWLMFCSGQLDMIGLSVDQADSVLLPNGTLPAELEEQGIRLHRTPRLDVYYLGFNMEDPLVGDNKALRQALSCAFNHEEWVRFYQQQVTPIYSPVPLPLRAGRTEKGAYACNLAKARHLLAVAGYPDGIDPSTGRRLSLTLDATGADNPQERQSNELIVSFMQELGVALKVEYSNRPTFFEKVRRGDVQLFRLSWIADYSDEHNFLQLFYGPNAHGCNRANYRNPAYDELFEAFMVLPPTSERDALAEKMVDLLIEDCPWIFMHQPIDYILTNRRIQNYVPHAFPGGMIKYYGLNDS